MDERPLGTPTTGFGEPAGSTVPESGERGFQQGVGDKAREVSARASDVAQRGKESARRIGSAVRSRAIRQADSRKALLASELENFAGTVDDVGRQLADRGRDSQQRYATQAADLMRKASRGLRQQSSEELWARAEDEMRARPGVMLGAFFALGFLGARLLRD